MDWLPLVSFFAAGMVAAYAQRAFYEAAAVEGDDLRSDDDFAAGIREQPSALFGIVAVETRRRLKALFRPHRSPRVERWRRLALLAVVVTLLLFAWFVVDRGS